MLCPEKIILNLIKIRRWIYVNLSFLKQFLLKTTKMGSIINNKTRIYGN